jgi:hypothetical protein
MNQRLREWNHYRYLLDVAEGSVEKLGEEQAHQIAKQQGPLAVCQRPNGLIPESSAGDSRRQKPPEFRQHFLNRLPDPHGQRSFLPTFSVSSLVPRTTR